MTAKILFLDIETSPNLAHVWRFWKENVGAKQVREHSSILSFAASWLDDDMVVYDDVRTSGELGVLISLYGLLDQADLVVAHNGARFDLPRIRGRGLVHGLTPPSPYKVVDTCATARKQFGFDSNSLEYLAEVLGLDVKKLNHKKFPGFELWKECLEGNVEAWEEMKEYNIHDVVVLKALYLKMLPYITNHPNVAVFADSESVVCPKCGSEDNQRRGFSHTNIGKYQRWRCNSCGGWHRSRYTENTTEVRKALATNII